MTLSLKEGIYLKREGWCNATTCGVHAITVKIWMCHKKGGKKTEILLRKKTPIRTLSPSCESKNICIFKIVFSVFIFIF